MCCTFSSAYLFPAKNGKNRKNSFFLSLPERTRVFCCFCIPFPREKWEKSKKNLFFFLCPNARVFFLFLHTFSARKTGKIEKFSFFLSLPERTRVFFVSAYLFPAKTGKIENFLFSFSARTHKRVRARKTTRAIQLSENRRGRFGIARTVTSSCGHCLKSAPKSARIVILLA